MGAGGVASRGPRRAGRAQCCAEATPISGGVLAVAAAGREGLVVLSQVRAPPMGRLGLDACDGGLVPVDQVAGPMPTSERQVRFRSGTYGWWNSEVARIFKTAIRGRGLACEAS